MSPTEDCLTDIIRLQLKKPKNWNWNLTTSKSSPHISLPTIQLFNSKGKLLVQTIDNPDTKRQTWHSSNFERNGRKSGSLQRCRSDNLGNRGIPQAISYSSKQQRQTPKNIQRCRSDSVANNPFTKCEDNFMKSRSRCEQINLKNGESIENSYNPRQRSYTCSSINKQIHGDANSNNPIKRRGTTTYTKGKINEITPNSQQSNILQNVKGLKMRNNSDEILTKLNKIKLKYKEREMKGNSAKNETDGINEKMKFEKRRANENGFYLRKSKSELVQEKEPMLQPSSSSVHCYRKAGKVPNHRRTTSDDLFKRRLKYSEESLKRAEQDGYRNFIVNEFDRIKQFRNKSKNREINNNEEIVPAKNFNGKTDNSEKTENNNIDNNTESSKKKKMMPEMCTAETILCDNKASHYQITELKEKRYKLRESRAGILIISDDSFSYNHRRRCHGEDLSGSSSEELKGQISSQKGNIEGSSSSNFRNNILNGAGSHERKIMENVKNLKENPNGKDIFRSLSYCSKKSNLPSRARRSNSETKLNNRLAAIGKANPSLEEKRENPQESKLSSTSKGDLSTLNDLFYYENPITCKSAVENGCAQSPTSLNGNKRSRIENEREKGSSISDKISLKNISDVHNSRQNSLNSDKYDIKSVNSRQSSLNSDKCEIRSLNSRQTSLNSEQNYSVQEPLTTPGSEVCEFVPNSDKDIGEIDEKRSLRGRTQKKLWRLESVHSSSSSCSDDGDQHIEGHIIQSAKDGRGKVTNCDLLQLVRRLSSPKLAAHEDNEATADKQQRDEQEASRKQVENQIEIGSTEKPERSVEDDQRHVKEDMGSNVSRHSNKGLSGRRSQSSGSICNGKSGRQNGDGKGSGGSLPSYLDDEDSIYNNNRCDEEKDEKDEDRIPPLGDGAAPLHWKFSDNQTTLSCHDQGYGSERSPEEEYPPPMPDHNLEQCHHHLEPHTCYPFITPETTFTVKLTKGSRGLGLSVTGGVDSVGSWPGLVRIKRLFPHQPASACGLLNVGDLLLEANGVALTGLSNYEALEVLRTASNQVELRVCRPPPDVLNCVSPISEVPPPPPTRREPPSTLSLPPVCYGNTPEDEYYHGEFEMTLTKIQGSLGFTLRKEDDSALGHYVRALVREPALTDGRVKAGDKIIAVNDVEISSMSHEQAVQFLRKSGDTVKLRLYRDAAQTPVSALSPTETTPRTSFNKKTNLRQEAVDMLNDIAVRKLIPGNQDQSRRSFSPNVSPRKLTRRANHPPEGDNQYGTMHEEQFHEALLQTCPHSFTEDDYSSLFSVEDDDDRPSRPSSLDLYNPNQTPVVARKPKFNFSLAHNAYELNNLDAEVLDAPNLTYNLGHEDQTSDPQNDSYPREPASMPHLPVDDAAFNYKNPVYQSAHLPSCSSSSMEASTSHQHHARLSERNRLQEGFSHQQPGAHQNTRHSSDSSYHPNEFPARQFRERVFSDCSHNNQQQGSFARAKITESYSSQHKPIENTHHQAFKLTDSSSTNQSQNPIGWKVGANTGSVTKVDRQFPEGSGTMKRKSALKKPTETKTEVKIAPKEEPEILSIELNRGWNSRLGFSLQGAAGVTYVSAVHADSVAARDGRIKPGDIILKVNDESVEQLSTNEIIDLLRIVRGPVCIVVKRNSQTKLDCSN